MGWLPQWRDTLLQVAYCGYPGSLDAAGEALGLAGDQQRRTARAKPDPLLLHALQTTKVQRREDPQPARARARQMGAVQGLQRPGW